MFEWRNEFATGVTEIDDQHKKLFEIGARLYEIACLDDDADHYDEITAILAELVDYTEYHFGFEEKLMQEKHYGGFDMHKIEHDFFVKKLRKIQNSDLDEDQSQSMMQIVSMVADWISAHILKTDAEYKPVLNA